MIQYPQIDPEIFRIGPLAIRWYGLMYLMGFISSMLLVRQQITKKRLVLEKDFVETLYSYLILGLLLGGRLGYVILYNPAYYIEHPLEIPAIWQGGMAFHGALAGTIIAGLLFCKKAGADMLLIADMISVTVPIGLGLGRIGIFPGEVLPRHPSQLYEFFLEGVVLFIILWVSRERVQKGTVTAMFLILYGIFRTVAEIFREPDVQIGYILGFLTMGQILSGIMILAGIGVYIAAWKPKQGR